MESRPGNDITIYRLYLIIVRGEVPRSQIDIYYNERGCAKLYKATPTLSPSPLAIKAMQQLVCISDGI